MVRRRLMWRGTVEWQQMGERLRQAGSLFGRNDSIFAGLMSPPEVHPTRATGRTGDPPMRRTSRTGAGGPDQPYRPHVSPRTRRPKPRRRLPPEVLTDNEVRALLAACPATLPGLRNR